MAAIALAVICLGAMVVRFAGDLRAHLEEDRVILGGRAVDYAIWCFRDAHGRLPVELKELVPEYIEELPASERIREIRYRVVGDSGDAWVLEISATLDSRALVYRWGNAPLSHDDKERLVRTRRGCYVLREE